MKQITKVRKEELKSKYEFPDTNYSLSIFVAIYDILDDLDKRITKLEEKK